MFKCRGKGKGIEQTSNLVVQIWVTTTSVCLSKHRFIDAIKEPQSYKYKMTMMARIQNNPNKKSERPTLYSSTKGRMQKILNWEFKTTFAIRRPTPHPLPQWHKFLVIFYPTSSFAIEPYIHMTDLTLKNINFFYHLIRFKINIHMHSLFG